MILIIGRDEKTSRLKLTADGKEMLFDSVPLTVRCHHCKLEVTSHGIVLQNLDINNFTFVDGQGVESKRIAKNNQIELGIDRYKLSWDIIDSVVPVNIQHLEQVWEDYDRHRIDQQIADRRFNSLRSATGIITMAAIALSFMTGRQSYLFVVLYALAILVSLFFTIKAWRDASLVPQRMQHLNRQFQHDYVCPRCKHFLGNQPYEVLSHNAACPYCKTNFIH